EPLSQNGSSADYINETIIQKGAKAGGRLNYGPMSYQAIILCNVQSLQPETAAALEAFVKAGGKLVIVGGMPYRSLSFKNAGENDNKVVAAFKGMQQRFKGNVWELPAPGQGSTLFSWTQKMLNSIAIEKDVEIDQPDPNVFQIRKRKADKDIFFFVN